MSVLLRNVTNALWHAFAALAPPGSAEVAKSRLKVLTANIGTLLDLYGVEKGLDHFRSTSSLSFHHFRYYLQKEVFASLPDSLPLRELHACEARVDEVCWLVCRARFLRRDSPVFPDACVYQLFRIFCLLAELQPTDQADHFQVLASPPEVGAVAASLVQSLGLPWDAADFEALSAALGAFRFPTFVALLEARLLGAPAATDAAGLREAVDELHQTYLLDVLKQGILQKRGYLLPTMREYWFVVQPTEVSYFKARGREQCGCIPLDPQCRVDAGGGEGGGGGGGGNGGGGAHVTGTAQRIVLTTKDRTIELAAPDHRSRLQWAAALRTAIAHSGARDGWQRLQASRRRALRDTEAARLREEALRRRSTLQDMEQTRAQLRAEKMAREAAECAARELEVVHRQEEARLRELEDVRVRLEHLLEAETAAKRDEEIVRSLQARVLAEEWEKREELERLQEEQRALLDEERRKRLEFERRQETKEQQLREAELRLKQLEEERLRLDMELRSAHVKATASEASKEALEARLRAMAPQLRPGDRVRRAASFAPSTRDRPSPLTTTPLAHGRFGGSLRRPPPQPLVGATTTSATTTKQALASSFSSSSSSTSTSTTSSSCSTEEAASTTSPTRCATVDNGSLGSNSNCTESDSDTS